jgi:hypothetical protein
LISQGLVSSAQKCGKVGENPYFQVLAGRPKEGREPAKLSARHHQGVIKSFWADVKLSADRALLQFCRTAQTLEAMMNNPSDHDQTVSQLGQTMAQTAESGRALVQDMTVFAKDESLRFVSLRLERNGAALDRLQNCQGVPGLIGVQQEWLRDLLQDYTGQSMRWMGAWRGLTRNVMEKATQSAAENIDRMQHEARDVMQQAEDATHHAENMGYQAVQQTEEQVGNIVQDTNNNYVQH